jgi:hypothetical protein
VPQNPKKKKIQKPEQVEEQKEQKAKRSKSLYRAPRPPLPRNKGLVSEQKSIKDPNIKKVNNIKVNKMDQIYNTDTDNEKRQSRIPRLAKASQEQIPEPKKYEPESDYHPPQRVKPEKISGMRRSQSYLQNKVAPATKDSSNDLRNARRVAGSANKPLVGNSSTSRRSVAYKPYTLREYKDKVNQQDSFIEKKRGGLGANIGGDEWMKEHEKRLRIKEFSNRVKSNTGMLRSDGMRKPNYSQNVEIQQK